jgi:hypothetical protein
MSGPAAGALTVSAAVVVLATSAGVLKARLRQENARYDELQAMLADELRALRSHVQQGSSALSTSCCTWERRARSSSASIACSSS